MSQQNMLFFSNENLTSSFYRKELGEDLDIIMLEMSKEEQEERIKTRHQGSRQAVELMRVGPTFIFHFKPHNRSRFHYLNCVFSG